MRTLAGFSRPAPAHLVLLGLLALLVWGQCAFHVNDGGSRTPAAPNLHLNTAVRLASIDSLSTHGPEMLYLTISLRNQSREPLRLMSLTCGLEFDKHSLGFMLRPAGDGVVVPGGTERLFPVVMLPYGSDDTHKGTNFTLLRAALQQGQLAPHKGQITVFYTYQTYPGSAEQANWRRRTLPLAR